MGVIHTRVWVGFALWLVLALPAQAQNDLPERLLDLFINNAPGLLEELNDDQASQPTQLTREAPQSLAQVQLSFAPVVQLAAPAVVNVYATRMEQVRDPFANMDPFFRRFFGDQMRQRLVNVCSRH